MNAFAIAAIVLVLIVAGGVLGAWLRGVLPRHHLSDESSKDMVKVGIGGPSRASSGCLLLHCAR